MCDKGILLRPNDIQQIFQLVKKEKTYDAINWNQYPTVAVDDKEKRGLVKIRTKFGVWAHLRNAQATGEWQKAQCDVLLHGKGGFVACHRIIACFSPKLKALIEENIREVGYPNSTTPISIFLTEFKPRDFATVLGLLYTGFASFPGKRIRSVMALIEFLEIDQRMTGIMCPLPEGTRAGRELLQHKESCNTDDENSDSDSESDSNDARVGDWVSQVNSANQGLTNKRPTSGENSQMTKKPKIADATVTASSSTTISPTAARAKTSKPPTCSPNLATSSGPPPLKPGEFRKVPPGSLIPHRKPEPRIIRPIPDAKSPCGKKSNQNSAATSTQGPSNTHCSTEPVAGCSKTVMGKADKPDKVTSRYERDEEYQPSNARRVLLSSSSSDAEEGSEESDPEDGDPIHFVERNLRSRQKNGRRKIQPNFPGLSIAENSKLNPRTTRSGRSGVVTINPVGPTLRTRNSNHQATTARAGASRPAVQCDSDDSDPEVSSTPSKYLISSSGSDKWDKKCYFCKTVFDSTRVLAIHSSRECGKHLKHQYTYPEKLCKICGQDFGTLTHYGLIRHVQFCYDTGEQVPPPPFIPCRKRKPGTELVEGIPAGTLDYDFLAGGSEDAVEVFSDTVPTTRNESQEKAEENGNKNPANYNTPADEENAVRANQSQHQKKKEPEKSTTANAEEIKSPGPLSSSSKPEDQSIAVAATQAISGIVEPTAQLCSDEIIPIGNVKVVMEKLSDDLVEQIIQRIRTSKGDKIDIPRVKGYNYVRSLIVPKTEIPDFFPTDTDADTAARIKELEDEMVAAQKESDARRERIEAEKRQKQKKQQVSKPPVDVRRVAPIIIRRVKEPLNLSPQRIYQGFINCSCGVRHPELAKALQCLGKRRLRKCWVCCLELSHGNPIENHLRLLHFNEGNDGTVACPVCHLALPYSTISKHCFDNHFKSEDLLESSMLEVSRKERTSRNHAAGGGSTQKNVQQQSKQTPAEITTVGKSHKLTDSSSKSKCGKSGSVRTSMEVSRLDTLVPEIIQSPTIEASSVGEVMRNISVDGDSALQITPSVMSAPDPPTTTERPSPIQGCEEIVPQETTQVLTTLPNRPDVTVTTTISQSLSSAAVPNVTRGENDGCPMFLDVEEVTAPPNVSSSVVPVIAAELSSSLATSRGNSVIEYRPGDIRISFPNRHLTPGTAPRNSTPIGQNNCSPYPRIPNPLAVQQQPRLRATHTRPPPPSYSYTQSAAAASQPQQGHANGHQNTTPTSGYPGIHNVLRGHLQQRQSTNFHQQGQQGIYPNAVGRPAQVRPIQLQQHQGHGQLQLLQVGQLQQQQMAPAMTNTLLMSSPHPQAQIFQNQQHRVVQRSYPGTIVTVESQSSDLIQNLYGTTQMNTILQGQHVGHLTRPPQPLASQHQQLSLPRSPASSNVIHQHNNIQIHYQSNTSNSHTVGSPTTDVATHRFVQHGTPHPQNHGTSMINQISGVVSLPFLPPSTPPIQTLQESHLSNRLPISNLIPPVSSTNVHTCQTCHRLFKSEVLFDTHFCSS